MFEGWGEGDVGGGVEREAYFFSMLDPDPRVERRRLRYMADTPLAVYCRKALAGLPFDLLALIVEYCMPSRRLSKLLAFDTYIIALMTDNTLVEWVGYPLEPAYQPLPQIASTAHLSAWCSNGFAHALILRGGQIVSWGGLAYGADTSRLVPAPTQPDDAPYLMAATQGAFAAVYPNGQIVAWGRPEYGGQFNKDEISDGPRAPRRETSSPTLLCATQCAFAAWVHDRLWIWGATRTQASDMVFDALITEGKGVRSLCATDGAFGILLNNGAVRIRGHDPSYGACSANSLLLKGPFEALYATRYTFVALLAGGGRVVTWGKPLYKSPQQPPLVECDLYATTVYPNKCGVVIHARDGTYSDWRHTVIPVTIPEALPRVGHHDIRPLGPDAYLAELTDGTLCAWGPGLHHDRQALIRDAAVDVWACWNEYIMQDAYGTLHLWQVKPYLTAWWKSRDLDHVQPRIF